MQRPINRTKTGKVLTDSEIEAMADEAERGFDVEMLKAHRRSRPTGISAADMNDPGPIVELWVDDHQEYEPGVVTAHLRHARIPLDPHPGDYLVVGDGEVPPALAEVLSPTPLRSTGCIHRSHWASSAESRSERCSLIRRGGS